MNCSRWNSDPLGWVKVINCICFLVLTGQKRGCQLGCLPRCKVKSYVWCVIRPRGVSSTKYTGPRAAHFSQNCCLGNGELIPKKSMFRGKNYMLSCRLCRPIQLLPNSTSSRVPQGVLRNAFQCPAKSPFAFQQWDLWHLRPSTHKGESKCSASTWGCSHQLKKYWSLIVSYY